MNMLLETDWSLFRPTTVVTTKLDNEVTEYVIISCDPREELRYSCSFNGRQLRPLFVECSVDIRLIARRLFSEDVEFDSPAWQLPSWGDYNEPIKIGDLYYQIVSVNHRYNDEVSTFSTPAIDLNLIPVMDTSVRSKET